MENIKPAINYPPGVRFIKNIYLFFAIVASVNILIVFFLLPSDPKNKIIFLLHFIFLWGVYLGIKLVKRWVVILVVAYSVYGLLSTLVDFAINQSIKDDHFMIIFMSMLMLVFLIFQLRVFLRGDTKEFFGLKGKII